MVLAWDTRMQRRVAIKRLRFAEDEPGRVRRSAGLKEARTAAMLNHPAIVTVFDFDTDSDEAFLVMEHIDGASLQEVLDEVGGRLDLDEAAALLEDVLSAIEFAHENGVLHLDLKPANVLITRDGRVKVADFGVAALSSACGHGPATGGTLGYSPIEQIRGKHCDERTDEWALGSLAYQVLTGRNPFLANTVEDAIMRAEVFEHRVPSALDSEIPHEADDAVMTALAPFPHDRYPSISNFADDLLPYLGDVAEGRRSLAEIASRFAAEEDAEATAAERATLGLWDRSGAVGALAARAAGGLTGAWTAWIGLSVMPVGRPAVLAGAALVAAAGVAVPALGALLGWLVFAAGVWAAGAPVLAVALGALALAYWWIISRRSMAGALLPAAGPLLALAHVPFVAPLLAGFSLPPMRAALAAGVAGLITTLAAAASGVAEPYLSVDWRVLADPYHQFTAVSAVKELLPSSAGPSSLAAVVAILGWPLAAAASSIMSQRATRIWAGLGVLVGTMVLFASYAFAARLAPVPASWEWIGTSFQVSLAASLILMLLVVVLGPPLRAEEESEDELYEPMNYDEG